MAHHSVFVRVLESLDQAQGFIDAAANRHIIDGDLTKKTFLINDEQSPISIAFLRAINAVLASDFLGSIGHKRILDVA